jgi:type IV pilus assembly protein PilV
MQLTSRIPAPRREAGVSMIEVLVALVIAVVGLLGLVGIQARAQIAEFESYQRTQALVLLNEMVDRMSFNRVPDALGYVTGWKCYIVTTDTSTGTPAFGKGYDTSLLTCRDASIAGAAKARADADIAAWNALLLGAGETITVGGVTSNVGALLGARGCITRDGSTGALKVSVAWQGMAPTVAPADTCGKGDGTNYGANDALRRVVSAEFVVPVLTSVAP